MGCDPQFGVDSTVWVPCDASAWRPGKVTSVAPQVITVEFEDDDGDGPEQSNLLQVQTDNPGCHGILPRSAALAEDGALQFDDLTELPELHAAELLHALNERFAHGSIYTFAGPILLAVNPFRTIPGLYGAEVMREFLRKSAGNSPTSALTPHVFAIAARALRGLQENSRSQTVLISGESGAGKTESTKFVMHYLALSGSKTCNRSTNTTVPTNQGDVDVAEKTGISCVNRQVLSSNPLLEAFGNSKTLRNDNSSRFGKYIELQFQGLNSHIVGGRIHTYLLERVRVIAQQTGERNYHIFYQIIAAAQTARSCTIVDVPWLPLERQQTDPLAIPIQIADDLTNDVVDLGPLAGLGAESFRYLTQDPSLTFENCIEDFDNTLAAMRSVRICRGDINDIFRVLMGILFLGNVKFVSRCEDAASIAECGWIPSEPCSDKGSSGRNAFATACNLLGVGEEALADALLKRTLNIKDSETVRTTNSARKAEEIRDALAKHLYQAVFTFIVQSTNDSIGYCEDAMFCGVLDIFGFEIFNVNSFEQLCINYTNELLQEYFNKFMIETEAQLYLEEEIEWKQAEDLPNNDAVVKLLRDGLFPMLEEECSLHTGGLSGSWGRKIAQTNRNNANFGTVPWNPDVFIVSHFAGPVTYTVTGFVEKNRDQLNPDALNVLKVSCCPFILQHCFDHGRANATCESAAVSPEKRGGGQWPGSPEKRGVWASLASPEKRGGTVAFSPEKHVSWAVASSPEKRCLRRSPSAGTEEHGSPFKWPATPRHINDEFCSPEKRTMVSPSKYSNAGSPQKKVTRPQLISRQFRQQLQKLLDQIRKTDPHFIRCIKPNPMNRPYADPDQARTGLLPLFDRKSVAEQLSYQGVLEAIRVARTGFPVRMRNSKFLADFSCLCAGLQWKTKSTEVDKDRLADFFNHSTIRSLLNSGGDHGSQITGIAIGRTRVFLKERPYAELRIARLRRLNQAATRLQAAERCRNAYSVHRLRKSKICMLQRLWRWFAAVRELRRRQREKSTVALQAVLRASSARLSFASALRIAVAGQRWIRSFPVRSLFLDVRLRTIQLQSFWRSVLARRLSKQLQAEISHRQLTLSRLRLQGVARRLVRHRRRNAAYRAWRAEAMANYRSDYAPKPVEVSREELVQELFRLVHLHDAKQKHVSLMRSKVECWQERLKNVERSAFVQVGRLMFQW